MVKYYFIYIKEQKAKNVILMNHDSKLTISGYLIRAVVHGAPLWQLVHSASLWQQV